VASKPTLEERLACSLLSCYRKDEEIYELRKILAFVLKKDQMEIMFIPTSKIELFARQRVDGWDAFGDQL